MTEYPIGFIPFDHGHMLDVTIRDVVDRLKAKGMQVGGLLQDGDRSRGADCAMLFLEDIGTGRRTAIFEKRGTGTRGCRLDPSGLAEAATWLQEAIAVRPDVLIVNRFGRQEAEGRGLVEEIGAALLAGIPVVVPVARALLPHWQEFAGEGVQALQNDAGAIACWCQEQAIR